MQFEGKLTTGCCCAGLKKIIVEEGVWRIQKEEKSSILKVFKVEDSGHGDILSENFTRWRSSGT